MKIKLYVTIYWSRIEKYKLHIADYRLLTIITNLIIINYKLVLGKLSL